MRKDRVVMLYRRHLLVFVWRYTLSN